MKMSGGSMPIAGPSIFRTRDSSSGEPGVYVVVVRSNSTPTIGRTRPSLPETPSPWRPGPHGPISRNVPTSRTSSRTQTPSSMHPYALSSELGKSVIPIRTIASCISVRSATSVSNSRQVRSLSVGCLSVKRWRPPCVRSRANVTPTRSSAVVQPSGRTLVVLEDGAESATPRSTSAVSRAARSRNAELHLNLAVLRQARWRCITSCAIDQGGEILDVAQAGFSASNHASSGPWPARGHGRQTIVGEPTMIGLPRHERVPTCKNVPCRSGAGSSV